MSANAKSLALRMIVGLLLVIGAERGLAWYGYRQFVPTQKLEAALREPPGSLVYTGDSRSAAGIDAPTLREGLSRPGAPGCVADLALGAVDIPGQVVILRAYLERGGQPRCVVIGFVSDSLLDREEPSPSQWNGNLAVNLICSKARDVSLHYPGFPRERFLDGCHFLLARLSTFHCYSSMVWMKTQSLQDRLTGRPAHDINRFGAIEDMAALRQRMEEQTREEFDKRVASDWRFHRWFESLRNDLRSRNVPLVLVELPMPESYRRTVSRSAAAGRLREWIAQQVRADGGEFLDLSDPAWINDNDFEDDLHLSKPGGIKLTHQLALRLCELPVINRSRSP